MKQKGTKKHKSMPVSQVIQILALWRGKTDQEKEEILRKIDALNVPQIGTHMVPTARDPKQVS